MPKYAKLKGIFEKTIRLQQFFSGSFSEVNTNFYYKNVILL